MTETQAYLELIFIVGMILSFPFLMRACGVLGRYFMIKFFPPETIELEIKRETGEVETITVNIKDNEALVNALLKSTGRSVY